MSFTYDTNYKRLTSMVDGSGTTSYAYYPVVSGTLGAGQLETVTGSLSSSAITYSYDQLDRVTGQALDSGTTSISYDALGRVYSVTNPLGAFNYGFVGASGLMSSGTYPNGQVSNYSYYPNVAISGTGNSDRRLQEIQNLAVGSGTLSQFDYNYDVVGRITQWTQANSGQTAGAQHYDIGYDLADQLTSANLKDVSNTLIQSGSYGYDSAGNRTSAVVGTGTTASAYNGLNQLTGASGSLFVQGTVNKVAQVKVNGVIALVNSGTFSTTLTVPGGTTSVPVTATDGSGNTTTKTMTLSGTYDTYDANGNMTADQLGRTYEWDAENRCTAINQGTHRTEMSYDGSGREIKRVEKQNGSTISTKQFVWCGLGSVYEFLAMRKAATKKRAAENVEWSLS